MRSLLAAILALCLLAAAPSAPAAERRVPAGWIGVTVDGPVGADDEQEWDRMVAAGVETVRIAFRWTLIRPKQRFPESFAYTDALVAAAAQRRMHVLPVIENTPTWAAKYRRDEASPPRDPADVRRFAGMLVRRYGPRGSFWTERPDLPRMPIRAWQIWNEPNLPGFWRDQPFARGYVKTLKAAARGVRSADPGAKVILAGLTNMSWIALRRIYEAGGRRHFDAVALHPYTAKPRDVLRVIRLARKEMRAFRDGRKPIWVTEFTWTAGRGKVPKPFIIDTTATGQARKLADVMRRFAAARKRQRIERVFWYTWLSEESRRAGFGWAGLRRLREGSVVDTPALRRFRSAARRLEGCAKAPGNAQRCA